MALENNSNAGIPPTPNNNGPVLPPSPVNIPPASPAASLPPQPQPAPSPQSPTVVAPTNPSVTPTQTAVPPVFTQPQTNVSAPLQPGEKKSIFQKVLRYKKQLFIAALGILLLGALGGAYLLGKSHERIVVQAPAPLPINLPPQAVVVTNCKPGRGKQYILPTDIPLGPVYDVVNNKVIAVEYNFKASDLFVNGDKLSDTLIPFFKGNYKTEYFVITPGTLQPGQTQADTPVNVGIFVVSKDEASKITCPSS